MNYSDVPFIIPLTRGQRALVDEDDYDRLSSFKWMALKDPHGESRYCAGRTVTVAPWVKSLILMHREVLGVGPEEKRVVDHINGDPLDNRKSNLRLATLSQNCRNSVRPKNNTSGFKGVDFNKDSQLWRARIHTDEGRVHLGYFDAPEKAYAAYCEAAIKFHGEFARLA